MHSLIVKKILLIFKHLSLILPKLDLFPQFLLLFLHPRLLIPQFLHLLLHGIHLVVLVIGRLVLIAEFLYQVSEFLLLALDVYVVALEVVILLLGEHTVQLGVQVLDRFVQLHLGLLQEYETFALLDLGIRVYLLAFVGRVLAGLGGEVREHFPVAGAAVVCVGVARGHLGTVKVGELAVQGWLDLGQVDGGRVLMAVASVGFEQVLLVVRGVHGTLALEWRLGHFAVGLHLTNIF